MVAILVVEDNSSQRKALVEFLSHVKLFDSTENMKVDVYDAEDIATAKIILKEKSIDLIISDLKLPDGNGIELVEAVRKTQPDLPLLILTAHPSIETAVEAVRKGANDYLLKPLDFTFLKKKLEILLETLRLRVENKNLKQRLKHNFQPEGVIGNAKPWQEVLEKAIQVAGVDVTILLEGENGTGKEIIANLIHENSLRAKHLFVKVNCGALTKSLLESELFGAIRGAYTGSEKDRPGYFEAANHGTIFLDEIGEMDFESQVRLLRVLEERTITRVGSTKPIPIDVRVIAATNKNLLQEINKGNFREDLYYRLSVIKLKLPPLRERMEDLSLLFNYFITQCNEKYNTSVTRMSPQLLNFCQTYTWPGNVREFRNVLEAMVIFAKEDVLQMDNLPAELQEFPKNETVRLGLLQGIIPGFKMAEYEQAILKTNLKRFNRNREKTAKSLEIAERTLYRKLREHNIS